MIASLNGRGSESLQVTLTERFLWPGVTRYDTSAAFLTFFPGSNASHFVLKASDRILVRSTRRETLGFWLFALKTCQRHLIH